MASKELENVSFDKNDLTTRLLQLNKGFHVIFSIMVTHVRGGVRDESRKKPSKNVVEKNNTPAVLI